MRVVSLLPSATEIVFALGIEPVGVSHECDYPPDASEIPAMNYARVDPDADSAAINEQVAAAESEGGVYGIDREALAAADPDLIVTQGVCDVCAVDRVLVDDAVADLDLDSEVLTLDTHSIADLLDDVRRIGAATGREERAEEIVAGLRERVEAVRERAAGAESRPRVAVLDWIDPVMVAGHWIPELVEIAGGEYGLAEPGARSTPREWAQIREYDPEVLIAAPCGFELDRTLADRDALTDRAGVSELAAVRSGAVYAMDGHHYVNRPGPRLVETLEFLAGLIQPERFGEPPRSVARQLSVRAEPDP